MTPRSLLAVPTFAMALGALGSVPAGAAQPSPGAPATSPAEAAARAAAAEPACAPALDAWKDRGRWLRLQRGMSRFDVLRLLGDPGKVSAYDGFERWEYPGALGARVNFDDRGRVAGWIAP